MAKSPTPEEAIERARQAQEDRISAIRVLAEARQSVADLREQTARELAELQASIDKRIGDAERTDLKAYNAAIAAGWSADELRKIGFSESEKKARARRRQNRKATPSSASSGSGSAAPSDGATTGDAAA